MVSQSTPIAELVHEVVVVGGPEHLYELDDVDIADSREDGDLVVGELGELGSVLELIHAHHLHCKQHVVLPVLGLVHVPVLPLPDLLQQHVVLNHLVHRSITAFKQSPSIIAQM